MMENIVSLSLKPFFHGAHAAERDFEYEKIYSNKSEHFLLEVLVNLKRAISEGKIKRIKRLSKIAGYVTFTKPPEIIKSIYENESNPLKNTNLVILACKYNQFKILRYLLRNYHSLFNDLCDKLGNLCLPNDVDETNHNAFYYAIRSNNVNMVDVLIKKWPGNYFSKHPRELDIILSEAYEELHVLNVQLGDQMKVFVENKLVNLRFFSDEKVEHKKINAGIIKDRMKIVLHNISLLNKFSEIVDERFVLIVKFIVLNICILKNQLKSTYDRIPWEEIEFCLTSFIVSQVKYDKYHRSVFIVLSKNRLLEHLNKFEKRLNIEYNKQIDYDIEKNNFPTLQRDAVVESNVSEFKDLYNDYKELRDIYSLKKINYYINVAVSTDLQEDHGKLLIARAVQVIDENMQNTLEAPKLSSITRNLLLQLLAKNKNAWVFMKNLGDLSNSLSLSHLQQNINHINLKDLQKDLEIIGNITTRILYTKKFKIIKIILYQIDACQNMQQFDEIVSSLKHTNILNLFSDNFKYIMEHNIFQDLINELSQSVDKKTSYETNLLEELNKIIIQIEFGLSNNIMKYEQVFTLMQDIIDNVNATEYSKYTVKQLLKQFDTISHYNKSIEKLALLTRLFYESASERVKNDDLKVIINTIMFFVDIEGGDMPWMNKFREKVNKTIVPTIEINVGLSNQINYEGTEVLKFKLSELETLLNEFRKESQLVLHFTAFKSNEKLTILIEMLLLDILSILDSSQKCVDNKIQFLNDYSPVLVGKALLNQIAHDYYLNSVLYTDPKLALLLNGRKLFIQNVLKSNYKVGKLTENNLSETPVRFLKNLVTLTNKENMFHTIEKGNLEDLETYLSKGVDINARSINLWTALHFAAKGSSIEVVKFVSRQIMDVVAHDINGLTPLHVAAQYGNAETVRFFIKSKIFDVNVLDNTSRTPLHIAAMNGHKDSVNILVRNGGSTAVKDMHGNAPLHYAVMNNYISVVNILIKKEQNVDANETKNGFTALHLAAEKGCLETASFLLENKAAVNALNDNCEIPLHIAASKGHVHVVNVLLLYGSKIDSRDIRGCVPLHYAVEHGHDDVVDALLNNGANINIPTIHNSNTPLHCACLHGHVSTTKLLLQSKADINISDADGLTSLHFAVKGGCLDIVFLLLQHGVLANIGDINGSTFLHLATTFGHQHVAELLLKYNANINAKDNYGATTLHYIASNCHSDFAKLAIQNNANVNNQDMFGFTPLHIAASKGKADIVELLLQNGAQTNIESKDGWTPLHTAAMQSNVDVVDILIRNKANILAVDKHRFTPLHIAATYHNDCVITKLISEGAQVNIVSCNDLKPLHTAIANEFKDILKMPQLYVTEDNFSTLKTFKFKLKKTVETLIANGAEISGNKPFLSLAIANNHAEIIDILIANGADVNENNGMPLLEAISLDHDYILKILLHNKANVDIKSIKNQTPLHAASLKGNAKLCQALISIGADINALTSDRQTPLYFAVAGNYENVTKILLANGADVDLKTVGGTVLHVASRLGYKTIVDVLLQANVDITIQDEQRQTALEKAVVGGHLNIVESLVKHSPINFNAKEKANATLLHIAANGGSLKIIKYLVMQGADIQGKDVSGLKPTHIAAIAGHQAIVSYFINAGINVNDCGSSGQTFLHFAAAKNHLNVAHYLIGKGADVNAQDENGSTPLHIAAALGCRNIAKLLLKNGAFYNTRNKNKNQPCDNVSPNKDPEIFNLLNSIKMLYHCVKFNKPSEIDMCTLSSLVINAKSDNNATALHIAAWKGFENVVNVLLKNKANPNICGLKGFTALHYAVKFSHFNIVKDLLSNGAIYNSLSDNNKTPLDFASNKNIIDLLVKINRCFNKLKNGHARVLNDLKNTNIEWMKAVMNARNRDNKSLIVIAIDIEFPKIVELKQICQGNLSAADSLIKILIYEERYEEALDVCRDVLQKLSEILGQNNPITVDMLQKIGFIYHKQQKYKEVLNILDNVYEKQTFIFGNYHKCPLETRSHYALILHKLGNDKESLSLFKYVYKKQTDLLGSDHKDVISTQFHMAIVLGKLGQNEEALKINYKLFENRKKCLGANHHFTLSVQNNIAVNLECLGKVDEALKVYYQVYETRKRILGATHPDTVKTLCCIKVIKNKSSSDDLESAITFYKTQKAILGVTHIDTMATHLNIGKILLSQGRLHDASKHFTDGFNIRFKMLGPNHPLILETTKIMQDIQVVLKNKGHNM